MEQKLKTLLGELLFNIAVLQEQNSNLTKELEELKKTNADKPKRS